MYNELFAFIIVVDEWLKICINFIVLALAAGFGYAVISLFILLPWLRLAIANGAICIISQIMQITLSNQDFVLWLCVDVYKS